MRRKFAEDVSRVVHDLGQLEVVSVKVASETASAEAQQTTAKAASGVYDVIQQKAAEECRGDFCQCVDKLATVLNKPPMAQETRAKLAAAVAVDKILSSEKQTEKIASARSYGRELVTEFLRDIL